MAFVPDRHAIWAVPLAAALLLWPALWNGYPIVFADTGTYLSQAIHRYVGWDRPPFYSLFMLPLHRMTTTWPVVVAQALLAAGVVRLVSRRLIPSIGTRWLPLIVLPLAIGTWLPFLVSELMPDVFTPLLILVLGLLAGGRATAAQWGLVGCATFMIAAQQSSLPLSLALLPLAWLGSVRAHRSALVLWPPALAVAALLAINLAAHGRFSVSPYGNVFLLARVIYDGPGMDVLRQDCPAAAWRLCPYVDRFPATSDDFLWRPDSPIVRAGGHKAVSAEAGAIIAAALCAEPGRVLGAVLRNAAEQLTRFASGDGLEPWPGEVSPWIERDFPAAEQDRYRGARQARGLLSLPPWLVRLHAIVSIAGVAGCAVLLPVAARRRHAATAFLLTALAALPVSAVITGGLSTPHDRYQARIMWLPPFVAALSAAALARRPA